MTSPRVLLECSRPHCRRHVHASRRKTGSDICKVCYRTDYLAAKKAREFTTGNIVGAALAPFYLIN